MADQFNVWPDGVPTSFGSVEFPMPEAQPALAFVGQDITGPYFVSFAIGAVVIGLFATNQFNKRAADPTDPVTIESKLLLDLAPMDLRNRRMIYQAYGLYVAVLLLTYWALSFYGRLILNWINNVLPTAGFKTDTEALDFSSPNWPLYVALGMIGVLPTLKPVEQLEVRLRRWAHRIAGVPMTIHNQVAVLRDALRKQLRDAVHDLRTGPYCETVLPRWVKDFAGEKAGRYVFEAYDQLVLLVDEMDHGWGDWTPAVGSTPVRRLVETQIARSQEACRRFNELIARTAPPGLTEEGRTRYREQLRDDWTFNSKSFVELRDGLLALFAVCAEQSTRFDRIKNEKLKGLMKAAQVRPAAQDGPELPCFWRCR